MNRMAVLVLVLVLVRVVSFLTVGFC